MPRRTRTDSLARFVTAVFQKVGMPPEDARWSAETLVLAELRGVSSHGVIRLPYYVRRFEAGLMNCAPRMRTVKDAGALALLDGDNGMGQVVARRAMAECIGRAERHNVGLVLLRGSNHFGAAATYSLMAAERGMIGLCTTNTTAVLAPFGGREKMIGNNPITLALPAEPPLVLDMALSAAARGYLFVAAQEGKPIPEGWGLDREGRPTTDPAAVLKDGSLSPIAGHKGSGLSIVIDAILCGLAGSPHGHLTTDIRDLTDTMRVTHLFGALRVEALVRPEAFRASVNAFTEVLRRSPRAAGVKRIWMPGEMEQERMEEWRREGIPLPAERLAELHELAERLGVPRLETD